MSAGLRCGNTTIKYLLFFFNFIFVLCGIVMLALGVAAYYKTKGLESGVNIGVILLIILGAVVFVVSFYGCCGAIRESHCMLVTFAVLMLTMLVIQVILAIVIFATAGNLPEAVRLVFEEAKKNTGTDENKAAKETVDVIQQAAECCGWNGSAFWEGRIPKSCCSDQSDSCGPSSSTFFAKSCQAEAEKVVSKAGKALGGVAIGVAVIEILGVWFALGLAGAIKTAERGSY